MDQIFIVETGYDWEGSDVVSVHRSLEGAQEAVRGLGFHTPELRMGRSMDRWRAARREADEPGPDWCLIIRMEVLP